MQDRFRYNKISSGIQDMFRYTGWFRYTGYVKVFRIGSGIQDMFRYTEYVKVFRIGSGIQGRFRYTG